MYLFHKCKREITLWCYSHLAAALAQTEQQKKKHSLSDPVVPPAKTPRGSPAVSRSKHDQCAMKVQEVEKIVKKLKEKHESKFSVEKLNAWAHMIHLEKHSSYETPPELPYFVGRSQAKKPSTDQHTVLLRESSASTSSSVTSSGTLSPTKRIGLRSECINQLDRWHSLLEKHAITQEQYDSLLQTILGDITKTT